MVVLLEMWVLVIIVAVSLQSRVLLSSQNLTCNSDDVRGLRGFMNGLESPIDGWWPKFSSSFSSSSCCNWVGINCNSTSGRIVRLELPNHVLTGSVSDSFSNLNHLRTLNLSHNFLTGPLPVSLFLLPHLEVVDLSGNRFNGVLPLNINLPALQVLDISDNAFGDSLPSGLCVNSTRIHVLIFAANYFNGTIPLEFGNCNFLEHLDVASNYLSGVIPKFLFTLPKLVELALHDNRFTDIEGIGNSTSHLVRLDISSNRFSRNIPDFFHRFPNLSYFSAHSNNLFGGIPPSLSHSPSISSLSLRNNSLDGKINFNCSAMVNLTSLDLASNNFSGTIPDALSSCQKLKALNLARNPILKGQIPQTFKNFPSLSYLSLSNCSLSNLSTALKVLQHCPNLSVLVLTMNFYNEQLPPDDDLQFKSLKALVIANSNLTGSIPPWLKGLTQLQLLDFSWNHMTGSIPGYLGNFKSLFYLDLSNNSFSGEIPKNLTRLESLISRDMSLKDPSPSFPFFKIRNMSARGSIAQYNQIMRFPPLLDLSYNHLTGPIWREFGNLKKLHVLDLKHNNLSGTIPGSLSGMRSIETLDLSFNSLTGTIPTSLVSLSFLSKFSVAYNNLTGTIPSGGQFPTFTNSTFEGNSGLCGDFFINCDKIQVPLQTPASENNQEDFAIILPVLTGFGAGFFVTVIALLVVPAIRDKSKRN
uniref:Leucine-rich repeat-containing N-terminal plant-type domain-containing protein n=1 Tax=Lactuca sativa TaxID=4236 RepID=A0A9R1W5J0_LACSA|nr:hypothetical protein LSAT_V11C300112220 [Lactuca sativa]